MTSRRQPTHVQQCLNTLTFTKVKLEYKNFSARPRPAPVSFRPLRRRDVGSGPQARTRHLLPPQRRQGGGHLRGGIRKRTLDGLFLQVSGQTRWVTWWPCCHLEARPLGSSRCCWYLQWTATCSASFGGCTIGLVISVQQSGIYRVRTK